jgi:hypothetical protein
VQEAEISIVDESLATVVTEHIYHAVKDSAE